MKEDTLIKISNKIKEKRREQNITVQDLAERAKVSKGLISQIENSRTVPSLIVLIDIIKALNIDLNVFFSDFKSEGDQDVVIIKKAADYTTFEKEDARGFLYKRIFTPAVNKGTVDIVLLELQPKAKRPMIETQAYEYKYILEGKVSYKIGTEVYELEAGDSILFDGRIPHTPCNFTRSKTVMLVVYFFEGKD